MAGLVIAAALSSDVSGGFILKMPILEIAFLGAFTMFLWLIFSIFRSGRM
jgi:ubiquinone biosynthesis protein